MSFSWGERGCDVGGVSWCGVRMKSALCLARTGWSFAPLLCVFCSCAFYSCVCGVCGVCWLLCFLSILFGGVSSPISLSVCKVTTAERAFGNYWHLLAISIVKYGDFSFLTRCFSMRYKEWKYFSFFHFILQHHAAWSLNRGGKVMIRKKFVTCDTSQQKRKGYALPFPTRAIYLLDV
jgi:hypothetical protein